MGRGACVGDASTLELVQQSLEALNRKRRVEGLKPVEEVRYRNLREVQDALLGREAC